MVWSPFLNYWDNILHVEVYLIVFQILYNVARQCNAYFSLSLHFSITFNSHIIFWYCSSIGLFQGWKQSYLHTCCSGCKLISIAFWYQFVLKIICNFGDDQLYLMLICGSYFLRFAISQLLNNCRNLVGGFIFLLLLLFFNFKLIVASWVAIFTGFILYIHITMWLLGTLHLPHWFSSKPSASSICNQW